MHLWVSKFKTFQVCQRLSNLTPVYQSGKNTWLGTMTLALLIMLGAVLYIAVCSNDDRSSYAPNTHTYLSAQFVGNSSRGLCFAARRGPQEAQEGVLAI